MALYGVLYGRLRRIFETERFGLISTIYLAIIVMTAGLLLSLGRYSDLITFGACSASGGVTIQKGINATTR
jgi:hypothetical protein